MMDVYMWMGRDACVYVCEWGGENFGRFQVTLKTLIGDKKCVYGCISWWYIELGHYIVAFYKPQIQRFGGGGRNICKYMVVYSIITGP